MPELEQETSLLRENASSDTGLQNRLNHCQSMLTAETTTEEIDEKAKGEIALAKANMDQLEKVKEKVSTMRQEFRQSIEDATLKRARKYVSGRFTSQKSKDKYVQALKFQYRIECVITESLNERNVVTLISSLIRLIDGVKEKELKEYRATASKGFFSCCPSITEGDRDYFQAMEITLQSFQENLNNLIK